MVSNLFIKNPARTSRLRTFSGVWLLVLLRVFSAQGQCSLACNQSVQVSLDQNGQFLVTEGIIAPYAAANCDGDFSVTLFNLQNQPIAGNTLTCTNINQTLSVKIQHFPSGNLCFGSVVAKDYLPPTLVCQDKFITCNAETAAATIGFPQISDNCTPLNSSNLTWDDQKTDLPCQTLQSGQNVTARIDRTWFAMDANGNTNSCLQKIWLKRATLADVIFPKNYDNFDLPSLNCNQNPNDLALTGQPKVDGRPIFLGGDCELALNFADQISPTCGTAGKQVLRSWTVSDYCANTFTIHVQVIKVEDKTPPTVQPPPNLTIGTDATACSATVSLPTATGSDDCSTFSITPHWQFGAGFGPFSGVPIGDHVVEYRGTDACGNSATATMILTVEDDKSPTAVCKPTVQISLGQAGTTFLNATSVDNGSTDNCQLAPVLVSRDGQNFSQKIALDCSDLAAPVSITLKIKDLAGNENTCFSKVTATDNLKPTIQCPGSLTSSCKLDWKNTAIAGQALASDNCGTPTVTFSDVENLNNCAVGTITRNWKATDAAGNSATCQQTISLTLQNSLAVQFPADKTISNCAAAADFSPDFSGKPILTGESCQPATVTFSDEIHAAPGVCFNILRKWKIIDWCQYQPGIQNSPGIWEKTQLIRVSDSTPPVISAPADLTVSANLAGCKAEIILPDATATDCNSNLIFSNNSLFATSNGANASGQFPAGDHSIIYTVSDGCGNSATASQKIKVLACGAGNFEVRGAIKNEKDTPVANIQVDLIGDGWTANEVCNAAGQFIFEDVPGGQTYSLVPKNKTGLWLNGVTTYDLLLMSRHILGVKPLDSPYKIIAADVNHSNSITTNDIVQLRKLILGIFDTVPGNTSWRFVPKNHVFSNLENPWVSPLPEQFLLNSLSENKINQDFLGIKTGDLNLNADAANPRSPHDTTFIFLENVKLKAGFPAQTNLKIADWKNLDGFQFEINFDTASVDDFEIEFSDSKILSSQHVARNRSGKLSVSWDDFLTSEISENDSLLFKLTIFPKTDGELRDVLKINNHRISAESYPKNKPDEPSAVQFRFLENKKRRGNFHLLQNRPNPFREKTNLHFELPVASEVTLTISDALGKVVFEKTEKRPRGWNDWEILENDLPHTGIFGFLLKSPDTPPAGGKLIFNNER